MTFAHTSVSLRDDSYVQLLRDYLYDRLGLKREVEADEALVSQIIAAAERRFVYVSFLADRFIALGRERVEPELSAATEGGRSGEALYGLWLAQLDRNFGRKEADRIRQVLCVLAAAELAHGWVFGEGARHDPVDGTPLTMLSEEFAGLPLEALATVLDSDVIDKIIKDEEGYRQRLFDPVLLFTLERIQGVLRTARGDAGGRRFRIGLKGLAEVMLRDEALRAGISRAQANLASHALDLIDRLLAEDAVAKPEPLDRVLIVALLPFAEAAVQLSGSELLVKRFNPDRVVEVLWQEHQRCTDEGRVNPCISMCSLTAALSWQPHGTELSNLPPAIQNVIAGSLHDRGVAKQLSGALGEAVADYDAAIRIKRELCDRHEPVEEWSIPLRRNLAASLQNRGLAMRDGGALAAAIADYDAAIEIMQELSDWFEADDEWGVSLHNDFAMMLMSRSNAKQDDGALTEALADYDAVVRILQKLRQRLEPVGEWSIPLRSDFAGSLHNRGLGKNRVGATHDAIGDFDAAIAVLQEVGDRLEPVSEWSTKLRNDLARSLQARGMAKIRVRSMTEAFADYDAAIAIQRKLRKQLEPIGEWSIPLRTELSRSFEHRGNGKQLNGELAEAIADYDAGIRIQQELRDWLEPAGDWLIPLRNEFVSLLQNRGFAKASSGALPEAFANYEEAIKIQHELREWLEPVGEWSILQRNDLAQSLVNRHNALKKEGRLVEAKADLVGAITILSDAIALAGADARASLQEDLKQWKQWLREM